MAFDGLRIMFLTGSLDVYSDETLRLVSEQSTRIVEGLGAAPAIPVEIVKVPTLLHPDAIRQACLDASADDRCIGVIAWMHTFCPAKMWIAGLQALQKPLLHLHTQFGRDLPWSSIDMDFMNLNQSAHGDREFAYIATRLRHPRKTVVGPLAGPGRAGAVSVPGRGPRSACHEGRHLKVCRFGDNMRHVADTEGDKTEVQARLGISCNTYAVNDLVRVVGEVADADVERLCAEYDEAYEVVPGAAARRRSPCLPARGSPHRAGPARLPGRRRLHGLHRHLRGPRWPAPAAGHRRPAADGGWLRLRRRRRLEVVRPGATRQGHGRWSARRHVVHGGLHLRLRLARPDAWCPHAGGLPEHRGRAAACRDPSALRGRARGPRASRLQRAARPGAHRRPRRHGQPPATPGQ